MGKNDYDYRPLYILLGAFPIVAWFAYQANEFMSVQDHLNLVVKISVMVGVAFLIPVIYGSISKRLGWMILGNAVMCFIGLFLLIKLSMIEQKELWLYGYPLAVLIGQGLLLWSVKEAENQEAKE